MATIIAGHKLTNQQRTVLDMVLDYMRKESGDSWMGPSTRPKGDGRWVPVNEIFPARNNHHNGLRRIVRKLALVGVLRACDIQYLGHSLKATMEATVPV